MSKIVHTQATEKVVLLLRECATTRSLGVVCGPNGSGKTTALKLLAKKYPTLGLRGKCLFHRCCHVQGPTRGVRDLLDGMGCREILFRAGASLQILTKYAVREFKRRKIQAIILDEADSWAQDSLAGVVTLQDACNEEGHPLALVMSGTRPIDHWIGAVAAGISRTLRVEMFDNLTLEECLGVLREWGKPFARLVRRFEKNEKDAIKAANLVHRHTAGNLRRMRFFADLFTMNGKNFEITEENVAAVCAKLLQLS